MTSRSIFSSTLVYNGCNPMIRKWTFEYHRSGNQMWLVTLKGEFCRPQNLVIILDARALIDFLKHHDSRMEWNIRWGALCITEIIANYFKVHRLTSFLVAFSMCLLICLLCPRNRNLKKSRKSQTMWEAKKGRNWCWRREKKVRWPPRRTTLYWPGDTASICRERGRKWEGEAVVQYG